MNSNIIKINQNIFRLKNEIHFISEKELISKPNPEKWSKKEILGHLIDSARYNLQRFNEILISDGIYKIQSYQQAPLVRVNNYQNTDLEELITFWQLLNKQICKCIKQLTNDQLSIKIDAYGEIKDMAWLIEDYVVHLEHHLNQILAEISVDRKIVVPTLISHKKAQKALQNVPSEFLKFMEFGELEIEYYKPNKIDKQTPHDRDELYIVSKGSGEFIMEEQKFEVTANDLLFVKAHDKHRFVNFSADFETWVIFYGIVR